VSESLQKYFHTDWSAMTRADWFGLVTVAVLTLLMVGLYVWVLKPGNKDKFERYSNFVNQDDEMNGEIGHGHAK
jgi:cytochrome c oxidase cbb3-type subunit 4